MRTREEKRELLLRALRAAQPTPREWVSADAVQRAYRTLARVASHHDPDYIGTIGVGRILSALARAGRCEKQDDAESGYMGYYRPKED